jgi:SOS-response transcriptional repressor LexA
MTATIRIPSAMPPFYQGGMGARFMAGKERGAEPTADEIERGRRFSAWATTAMNRAGLNKNTLSIKSGISNAYLGILLTRHGISYENEYRRPSEEIVRQIADATGWDVADGMKAAGYDAPTVSASPFASLPAESQFLLAQFLKSVPGVVPLTSSDTIVVPVLGRVSAGTPIFSEENIRERLPIPRTMIDKFDEESVFAVRVQGDCLTGLMIADGDLLICRQAEMAKDGDVVVVMSDEEEAVCKVFRENAQDRHRWLETRPLMGQSSVVQLDGTPRIIGVKVGLFRAG